MFDKLIMLLMSSLGRYKRSLLVLLSAIYVGYFVYFGYEIAIPPDAKSLVARLLLGTIFAVIMLILFFAVHFSGSRPQLNIRLIAMLVLLAIGGTILGVLLSSTKPVIFEIFDR